MQYVPNLGEEPAGDARRDAVHVAVAPVIADHALTPGQHVRICKNGYAASGGDPEDGGDTVGIVDPFRSETVTGGKRFWLFLYPNTVTSLRHVWTHPAFIVRAPRET